MKASQNCINLIKHFEGYATKPYRCPAGYWTIGYGHVISRNDVERNAAGISPDKINLLLENDLAICEKGLEKLIKVTLTQGQFDALIDFSFNLGLGSLQRSGLRSKINRGEFADAVSEFSKWVWGGGRKLSGLIKRRAAEAALFSS